MSADDRWTIKRLLEWTAGFFRENGSDQPRLEAEILLAEALDCQRIELYTRFDEEPMDTVKGVFRDWVARHAEGEPVAYLVGHREFFSLKFDVDSSVLIPRPETEHLVTEALDFIKSQPTDSLRVVDVGTGSGCVAVAICKHAPQTAMFACDISDAVLAVAKKNAAAHDVSGQITFAKSDLLSDLKEPDRFHLIVSNPPYIGLSEKADLDKSVVDFEPHQALFSSGPDGTETIQRLIQQSVDRLVEGGILMFEVSPMIAERSRELVESTAGLAFERIVSDLAGNQRIVMARRK